MENIYEDLSILVFNEEDIIFGLVSQ